MRADRVSRVYEGFDLRDRRRVTVEILRDVHARDSTAAARFLEAGRMATSLQHPNIARVTAAGDARGLYFIVSDPVDGTPLREVITRSGALQPERAAAVTAEVCDALTHAHQAGIVHGGLTPADILLTSEPAGAGPGAGRQDRESDAPQPAAPTGPAAPAGPVVKVSRFGVVASAGPLEGQHIRYAAPDQPPHRNDDRAGDLYATGCCLREMLTGRPPEPAPQGGAGAPALPAGVPADLASILTKLLAPRREDRYPTAAAARDDLARYLTWDVLAAPGPRHARRAGGAGARPATDTPAAGNHSMAKDMDRRRSALVAAGALLLAGAATVGGTIGLDLAGSSDDEPATTVAQTSTSSPSTTDVRETTTSTSTSSTTSTSTTTTTEAPTTTQPSAPEPAPTTAPTTTSEPTTTRPPRTTTTVVRVPSVIGMREGEAAEELGRYGLSMAVEHVRARDHDDIGRVVGQRPDGGERAPDNRTVRVWIAERWWWH